MSKHPKKKDYWWILVLILIFSHGLIGAIFKAAMGLLIPVGIVAVVIGMALRKSNAKKTPSAILQEEMAQAAIDAERAKTEAEKRRIEKERAKKLKQYSRSGPFPALTWSCYGIGALMGLCSAISAMEKDPDTMLLLVMMLWFLGAGGVFHVLSAIRKQRARDAVRYATLIGDRDSYSLTKLSSATSYKIGRIKKDLQRMIDEGLFGESAYLDMANLCFMRTPEAIPDGVAEQLGDYSRIFSAGVAASEGENEADTSDPMEEDTDYSSILKKIRQLDVEIQDESVSERIRKIETITRHIFEYVKEKPEKTSQIRMFMSYYLPTTLKLLESYSRIERVGVAGQNMQEAKDNIEKTLDMLTVGFQQQFDLLFQAENLDITSDIEVLEQMMKKDGLRENRDFIIREEYEDSFTDDLTEGEGGTAAKPQK